MKISSGTITEVIWTWTAKSFPRYAAKISCSTEMKDELIIFLQATDYL